MASVLSLQTFGAGSWYQQAAACASGLFSCSRVRYMAALSRLGKALLTSMARRTEPGLASSSRVIAEYAAATPSGVPAPYW
eukprot:5014120-Prorocentrum_lima.AAC.1